MRRRQSGVALITALAAVVVVTTAATVMTAATLRAVRTARDGRLRATARLAAEGGVEAARAALSRDPAWTGGDVTVGDATARVEVRPGAAEGERVVVSFTRFGPDGDARPSATATVETVLRLGGGLPRVVARSER